jgi:glutaredoxin
MLGGVGFRSPMPEVVLYTRAGCHLCDDAKVMLIGHGLTVQSVDIDSDPALIKAYGECIPVVVVDGRERFRGRVDPVLLRRLLRRS